MNPAHIDLDWELGVFKAVRALWRAVAGEPESPWDETRVAHVGPLRGRLAMLGSMMAETPLTIEVARRSGGIRGTVLLLPQFIDIGPDPEVNRAIYVLRVCMDATMVRSRPSTIGPRSTLYAARDALATLTESLPRFGEAWAEVAAFIATEEQIGPAARALLLGEVLPDPGDDEETSCVLWGRLLEVQIADDLPHGSSEAGSPGDSIETEHEAPGIEELTISALKEEDSFQLPIHSFEKVELLETFNGNLRQLDGDDELEDHLDALDEVDLGHLVRGGPEAGSVYRAEVGLDAEIPDVSRVSPEESAVLYPEWDRRQAQYRPDWCAVYPTLLPRTQSNGSCAEALKRHRGLVSRLYDTLLIHRSDRVTTSRQPDGGEIDLDAVVAAQADLLAGRQPSNRLYVRRPRQRRDIATTVLLDISLSSDSWVEGRRVLDVAREAIWVLGEVAERLGDRLQVLAFASHTRNRIRVFTVRDWNEPWSVGQARLENLQPQGYTRIGPALRHATAGLAAISARQKLLLVVTDGKPTDFDRYEGGYGVQDVRKALHEAKDHRIGVHALAIDAVARHALPTMFGTGRWTVLSHPDRLPEGLGLAYGRLIG